MALEDFFTLTEMKDGLTVRLRVEELVAVMNKEKDCVVKNVGDAMRQWSTVASVIAVTENKDCLDHFIQLDGLLFIDTWLKNMQKFSPDASDCSIEESILTLLHALEKLKIDTEKLTSSGIYLTVTSLLSHKSSNIQDRAKSVLGILNLASVSEATKYNSDEAQAICEDRMEPKNRPAEESDIPMSSPAISSDQKPYIDEGVHQPVGINPASSECCVDQQSEGAEAAVKEPDKAASHCSDSDPKEGKVNFESSVRKEACSSEKRSVSDRADRDQGTDVKNNSRKLESSPDAVDAETHNESLANKWDKAEVYPASNMPKPVEASSSLNKINGLVTDVTIVRASDNHVDSSTVKSMSNDLRTGGSNTKGDDTDRGVLMNCTSTLAQKIPKQDDESRVDTEKSSSASQVADRGKNHVRHLKESSLFESSRRHKSADVTSKMSAVDLEYGTVDALEVACLVAKEVERQVNEDYDEQFGSFSKNSSRGGSPSNETPVEKMSDKDSDSSGKDESSTDSGNVDAAQEICMKVAESSQVTDTAPEAANSADKGTSEIDLNLEICSEADEDAAGNSAPNHVAVVSASRAVATPGLATSSPLKFEGDLGWKGSAATSAFRPASPHKTSDGDNATILVEEGRDFLIDLNLLAEGGDDKTIQPVPSNPSPRRPEKLGFDLNQMSEDGDAALCSSPASSSSSLKPTMRNFDLNVNFGDPSDLQPCLSMSSSHKATVHGAASDNSVISIMGAKVKKNTSIHQAPLSFFNGSRASDPVADSNFARSGPPSQYGPQPIYNYNGIPMRPPPTMQYFHHPMYGPSGPATHMLPQFMGTPYPTHQPSFTTNMVGPLPSLNGASSYRPPHLNFNPGFVMEGANRVDPVGFRQFVQGQVRSSAEEHSNLQPLFPGFVGGKRKEPDGGWEPYVTNYKHHQPPQL